MPRANRAAYNAYMREYMLRRYHKRRAAALILLGNKCARCPCATQLQFDHKIPAKKSFKIDHLFTTATWERVLKELKKCQLLCGKCHAEKTVLELGNELARGTHGTLSAMRYCKPICDLCREARNVQS